MWLCLAECILSCDNIKRSTDVASNYINQCSLKLSILSQFLNLNEVSCYNHLQTKSIFWQTSHICIVIIYGIQLITEKKINEINNLWFLCSSLQKTSIFVWYFYCCSKLLLLYCSVLDNKEMVWFLKTESDTITAVLKSKIPKKTKLNLLKWKTSQHYWTWYK